MTSSASSRTWPMASSLLVVAALAGSVWWFVGASDEPGDAASATAAPVGRATDATAPSLPGSIDEPPATPAGARTDVAGIDLSKAVWVDGRVAFPPGTPPDEHVEVLAFSARDAGSPFADVVRPSHELGPTPQRCALDAEGRFRAPFAPSARFGRLQIDARYLVLSEAFVVRPSEPRQEVVLEPELGGVVRARVLAPDGSTRAAQSIASAVRLEWLGPFDWMNVAPAAPVEGAHFEFRQIPASRDLRLQLDTGEFAPLSVDAPPLARGELREVTLRCLAGGRIEGRVVDQRGRPVAGARLVLRALPPWVPKGMLPQRGSSSATPRPPLLPPSSLVRQATSGAGGEFTLRGLPTERGLQVLVRHDGYLPFEVTFEALREGQVRDVLLELDAGRALGGVVRMPDGRPAPDATVSVMALDSQAGEPSGAPLRVASGPDGAFVLSPLPDGHYLVRAELREAAAERGDLLWQARIESTPPRVDLELALEPAHVLRAIVVDDRGAPLERFDAQAQLMGAVAVSRASGGLVKPSPGVATSGRFTLEGLQAGLWGVSVRSNGHEPVIDLPVQVPFDGPELRVVLARTPSIRGIVVDESGAPVSHARVTARRSTGAESEISGVTRRTDASGRFDRLAAPVGRVEIVVRSDEHVQERPPQIELSPGDNVDGVRVEVRRAATVRVSFDLSEAEQTESWRVALLTGDGLTVAHAKTTGAKRGAEFRPVAPGVYTVRATAGLSYVGATEFGARDDDSRTVLEQRIEVRGGERVEVVLRDR